MDTKSKGTNLARGLFSWFCYLLVFFTLIAASVYSIALFTSYGSDIFTQAERVINISAQIMSGELRDLDTYKESASSFFEKLYYNTRTADTVTEKTREAASNSLHYGTHYLESISRDNLYCVIDYSKDPSGIGSTNDPNWTPGTLPEDFNYLFVCENRCVSIYHKFEGENLGCVYSSEEAGSFYTNTLTYTLDALRKDPLAPDIYFAVREEATSYYASNEIIGSAQNRANRLLFQFFLLLTAAVLFLLMLLFGIIFRRDRLLFTARLSVWMRHIWIEFKLLLTFILFAAAYLLVFVSGSGFAAICGFCLVFLYIHLLLVDLSHNRRIWRHNIVHSVLKFISQARHNRRFDRIEHRKFIAMVIVLSGLVLLTLLVTLFAVNHHGYMWRSLIFFYGAIASAAAGTLFWFGAALREDLRDYGILMDQIEKMYKGDLNAVNHIASTSPLYSYAMQLNMIRDGIRIAVDDGVRSERTKVELITNVSHDIKTPLTSIISYIELLKAEDDLPPHVKDYVSVISQKAERLRAMIQDIFDVSKATTGNISLNPEHFDLKTLLRQTLADMDELIQNAPLQWRIQIPEDEYPVYVDGQRMYRVFQNIIKNAAQYALEGSRVYVVLVKQEARALLSVQNISKHEISQTGEELTARFVRGDASRSSTGSGLGLSIAKSFTEACGGTFRISVNGDQFNVEITLPLESQPFGTAASEKDDNAQNA